MKTIKIIISGDYEVFGNGTGDVMNCMIKPTNDILNICDRHGVKYTIFAEMCEYWAFKKYSKDLKNDLGYMPHIEIENQLHDAIKRGHDVQLHLHPQWIGAEYKNKKWILNYKWWRLPSAPHGLGAKDDIKSLRGIFHTGKSDLEYLLKVVSPEYQCIAFRAGAYCIQPVRDVFNAMKAVGIYIDSTVHKWDYNIDDPYYYDFRNAYSNVEPWRTHPEDINRLECKGEGNIIEVPILSVRLPAIGRLLKFKEYALIRNTNIKKYNCVGHPYSEDVEKHPMKRREKIKKILKIFGHSTLTWDYCVDSEKQMEIIFNKAMKDTQAQRKKEGVFVMTGHPKSFTNPDNLHKFLSFIEKFDSEKIAIHFSTFSNVAKTFEKEGF